VDKDLFHVLNGILTKQ